MTTFLTPIISELYYKTTDKVKNFKKERQTLQEMFDFKPPVDFTKIFASAFKEKNYKSAVNENGKTSDDIEEKYNTKDVPVKFPVKVGFATAKDYTSSYGNLAGGHADHLESVGKYLEKDVIYKSFSNNKFRFKSIESRNRFIEVILGIVNYEAVEGHYIELDELNRPITYLKVEGSTEDTINSVFIYTASKDTYDVLRALYIDTIEPVYDGGHVTVIDAVGLDGLKTRKVAVPVIGEYAQAAFYPWMDGVSPEEYMQSFMDAKEQISLFYGIPGSGKSTLIKTGIAKLGIHAIMCAKASLTGDATFVTSLLKHLADNKEIDLVVLEDADALMVPRSQGNVALNELLSATDGIGRMKFKLILTSNADDTSGIDTALIRHGRAFDVMKFGRLTPVEANNARRSIGLDPITIVKPVTLAQAISKEVIPGMISGGNDDHVVVSARYPLKTSSRNID